MNPKDRTSEEKQFDGILKTALMCLGDNPANASKPIPFPYYLAWDKLGRKGQRCTIIRLKTTRVQVRFEDGYTAILNRQAVRRI